MNPLKSYLSSIQVHMQQHRLIPVKLCMKLGVLACLILMLLLNRTLLYAKTRLR